MLSVNAPHVPALHISHSSRTLGDMLRKRVEATPDRQAFFEREGSAWRPHTWSQVYQKVLRIAAGLRKLSLRRGDRLAIVGPTQLSWSLYDLAAQLLGLVSFGIYQGQTAEQIRYLLDHSQAQVVSLLVCAFQVRWPLLSWKFCRCHGYFEGPNPICLY